MYTDSIIDNDINEWAISCKGGNCCNRLELMVRNFHATTPSKAELRIKRNGFSEHWNPWKDATILQESEFYLIQQRLG